MSPVYESKTDCEACPGRIVCNCLQVTEDAVALAITTLGLRNLREIRRCTGAGEGCTACHEELLRLLRKHAYGSASAFPICSVK